MLCIDSSGGGQEGWLRPLAKTRSMQYLFLRNILTCLSLLTGELMFNMQSKLDFYSSLQSLCKDMIANTDAQRRRNSPFYVALFITI